MNISQNAYKHRGIQTIRAALAFVAALVLVMGVSLTLIPSVQAVEPTSTSENGNYKIAIIPDGSSVEVAQSTETSMTYTLKYNCSGLTGDCHDSVLTMSLPLVADPEPPNALNDEPGSKIRLVNYSRANGVSPEIVQPAVVDGRVQPGKMTWNMGTLRAGVSEEVKVSIAFPQGVIPNGSTFSPVATLGDGTETAVDSTSTTLIADPELRIDKEDLRSVPAKGTRVTYTINASNAVNTNENGKWTHWAKQKFVRLHDVVIVDQLPACATYISSAVVAGDPNPENGFSNYEQIRANGGTYDPDNNSVRFELGDTNKAFNHKFSVTVVYEEEKCADVEDIVGVTNNATITGKEWRTQRVVSHSDHTTHGFGDSRGGGQWEKVQPRSNVYIYRGAPMNWDFRYNNTGNLPWRYHTVDLLPCGLSTKPSAGTDDADTNCEVPFFKPNTAYIRPKYKTIQVIWWDNHGKQYGPQTTSGGIKLITDDGTWAQKVQFEGTLGGSENELVTIEGIVNSLPPDRPHALPESESGYTYADDDNYDFYPTDPDKYVRVQNVVSPESYLQYVNADGSYGEKFGKIPGLSGRASYRVLPHYKPVLEARKYVEGSPVSPGGAPLTFQIISKIFGKPTKPVMFDLLNCGASYRGFTPVNTTGSWEVTTKNIPDPDGKCETRQLVRAEWTGDLVEEPSWRGVNLKVDVLPIHDFGQSTNNIYIGAKDQNDLWLNPSPDDPVPLCFSPGQVTLAPSFLTEEGVAGRNLCTTSAKYSVNEIDGFQVEKYVKGSFDTEYRGPGSDTAILQNGPGSYKIVATNNGNIEYDKIVIYDVFPFVNDTGVGPKINEDRQSAWAPVLTGPVGNPTFKGVTPLPEDSSDQSFVVQYSKSTNPCRGEVIGSTHQEMEAAPAGCDPNWEEYNEADKEEYKAIRVIVQAHSIGGGDSVSFEIPVTAKENYSGTAWNSVALAGHHRPSPTREDTWNSSLEPIRVGLHLADLNLNVEKSVVDKKEDTYVEGDSILYAITVRNNGVDPAPSSTVTEVLPDGLSLDTSKPNGGWVTTSCQANDTTPVESDSDTTDSDAAENRAESSDSVSDNASTENNANSDSDNATVETTGEESSDPEAEDNDTNSAGAGNTSADCKVIQANNGEISEPEAGSWSLDTGTWFVPQLNPGDYATLYVWTTVNRVTTQGSIVNRAEFSVPNKPVQNSEVEVPVKSNSPSVPVVPEVPDNGQPPTRPTTPSTPVDPMNPGNPGQSVTPEVPSTPPSISDNSNNSVTPHVPNVDKPNLPATGTEALVISGIAIVLLLLGGLLVAGGRRRKQNKPEDTEGSNI